jgi:hypothetical protein
MRYAILVGDMVVGDGVTEEQAWADAAEEAKKAGLGELENACAETYDERSHEPRLHGGIVCLMPRAHDLSHGEYGAPTYRIRKLRDAD